MIVKTKQCWMWEILTSSLTVKGEVESKETYGQTRGLGNLEMKHIGELAITDILLNAVKTSRVCTM